MIGAIALQGIRLVQPTLGETVVVTGLGLIGLVAVQLLRAHGCRVLGLDFDASKLALAREFGAETVNLAAGEDPIAAAQLYSRGRGVDAVLITASTKSNEPIHQAAPDVPQARTHRTGRRGRPGDVARRFLREGTDLPGVLLVRSRAATMPNYEEKAMIIRSASCAGPSSAISRRCSICWPMAGSISNR